MRNFPFGLVLAVMTMTMSASARPDLKITTVRRLSRGFSDQVQTDFVQADRMRTEGQHGYRQALWPGGPSALFRGPRVVTIIRCDLGQRFTVNLGERTYSSEPYPHVPTEAEKKAYLDYMARTPQVQEVKPRVLVEISTKDIGERKQMFGYTARHIMTTRTETPFEDTTESKEFTDRKEYVTDGWYIDLDSSISCMPKAPPGSFAYGFLTVSNAKRQPDVPTLKLNGNPETGFALVTKTTTRSTLSRPNGSKYESVFLSETEVTDLSTAPLDPALFEVPAKFVRTAEMNLAPSLPVWARWLMQAHSYWRALLGNLSAGPKA